MYAIKSTTAKLCLHGRDHEHVPPLPSPALRIVAYTTMHICDWWCGKVVILNAPGLQLTFINSGPGDVTDLPGELVGSGSLPTNDLAFLLGPPLRVGVAVEATLTNAFL